MSNVKKADQRAAKKYLLDLLPKCSQKLSYGKGEAYIYTNQASSLYWVDTNSPASFFSGYLIG